MTPIRRHLFRSFPLLLLALATTSAPAADNYLKLIPSTALAWGAVNHMNEASDKIQKLAAIVQAPTVSVLEEIKKDSGLQKGLDEKGAAGFFVVPGKTEKEPAVMAFVAIADEKQFLGNFEVVQAGEKIREVKIKTEEGKIKTGESVPKAEDSELRPARSTRSKPTICIALREGYVLVVPKSDRAALEAALEAKQSIAAEMAGLESWLAENDGTVVGTSAGIKLAAKLAAEELKKSKDNVGNGPEAAILRPFLDIYGKVLAAAPNELSLATAGIRCDKQNSIRVIGRARLIKGGLVSLATAAIPPAKENLLAGVPGGPFFFAGGGVSISSLLEGYMNLAFGLLKNMKSVYGVSAEDLDQMSKDSSKLFRQVRSMNLVMKIGKRGDPLYSNIFSTMRVDNARQMFDLQEKYTENSGKRFQQAKPGMFKSMTVKRLEIAGKPALQQEIALALPNLPGGEGGQALFDQMFGPGGKMVLYYVALDEHRIVMGMNVSPERMATALDIIKQPKKCLAEDADVSVTAAMLPANSQWVAYVSFRGYARLIQRMMAAAQRPGGRTSPR